MEAWVQVDPSTWILLRRSPWHGGLQVFYRGSEIGRISKYSEGRMAFQLAGHNIEVELIERFLATRVTVRVDGVIRHEQKIPLG
jgi:hypothetical protein